MPSLGGAEAQYIQLVARVTSNGGNAGRGRVLQSAMDHLRENRKGLFMTGDLRLVAIVPHASACSSPSTRRETMTTPEERTPLSSEVSRLEAEVGPHAHHP